MLNNKILLRKCVGCNTMKDKKTLIRIVKNKEDFFIDTTGKKQGRGAYICNTKFCIEKTIKNKRLERSFKSNIPSFIYENLKNNINTKRVVNNE